MRTLQHELENHFPQLMSSSVGPHYRGMNAAAIYDVLHRNFGTAIASEYETKAEFSARLEKIKSLFCLTVTKLVISTPLRWAGLGQVKRVFLLKAVAHSHIYGGDPNLI
jgi:hypothetical protein